jgi:hypothetical protein
VSELLGGCGVVRWCPIRGCMASCPGLGRCNVWCACVVVFVDMCIWCFCSGAFVPLFLLLNTTIHNSHVCSRKNIHL